MKRNFYFLLIATVGGSLFYIVALEQVASFSAMQGALLLTESNQQAAIIGAVATGIVAIFGAFGAAMRGFHEVRKLKIELASRNYSKQLEDSEKRHTEIEKQLREALKRLEALTLDAATAKTELAALRERHVAEVALMQRIHEQDQATIKELREKIEAMETIQATFRAELKARGYREGI